MDHDINARLHNLVQVAPSGLCNPYPLPSWHLQTFPFDLHLFQFCTRDDVLLPCIILTYISMIPFTSTACLIPNLPRPYQISSIPSKMRCFFLLHTLFAASLVAAQSVTDLPSCSVRFPFPDAYVIAALTWTCSFLVSLLLSQQPIVPTQITFASVQARMLLLSSLR